MEFVNGCFHDVKVKGWDHVVAGGTTWSTTAQRPSSNRIEFKFNSGTSTAYDFIELNSGWSGPGDSICGHPSYSSYNGYNMASKYEALNTASSRRHRACMDPGAEVDYALSECPTGEGNGYKCKGSSDCSSAYSNYIKDHSWALNHDGTRTHRFTQVAGGLNYANFWCSEIYGFRSPVATMTDCVDKKIPIVLRVTTCDATSLHDSNSSLAMTGDESDLDIELPRAKAVV